MLNIKNTLIGIALGVTLFITGCSDSEQHISLEMLKAKGFKINPESKPAIEMFGAKDGWKGELDGKDITVLLFDTSSKAEAAVTANKTEFTKGIVAYCNAANIMLIADDDDTCVLLVQKLK